MLTALLRRNTKKGTTRPDTSIRGRHLSTHGEPTSLHKRLTSNPAQKQLLSPIQCEAPAPTGRHLSISHQVFSRKDYMTNLTETATQLGAKVSEAQARAEDLSRAAGKKLDEARMEAAGALHTAASSVRTTARQGCEVIDGLATSAADKLDATASYVEDHDLRGVLTGCRRLIRRYPTGSLMFATAIGFFAGSAVRRITHSCAKKTQHS